MLKTRDIQVTKNVLKIRGMEITKMSSKLQMVWIFRFPKHVSNIFHNTEI